MNRRAGRQTSADPIGTPTSIYVMDVDGSHLTRITTGTGDEGDGKPAYSPNSRRIDFIRNGAIEIVNADGTGIWEIVGPEAHASTPRWSPDGLRILYGDNTDSQSGARIISLRGGAPALVGQINDAGWSPDAASSSAGSGAKGCTTSGWPPCRQMVSSTRSCCGTRRS